MSRGTAQERRDARMLQVAACQQLKAEGLNARAIGVRLGLSMARVRDLLSDPDMAKRKKRQERYAGECVDCGFPTAGQDGYGKAPLRCDYCARGAIRPAALRPRLCVPIRLEDIPLEIRMEAVRAAGRRETERAKRDELLFAAIFPSDQTYWISESAHALLDEWQVAA